MNNKNSLNLRIFGCFYHNELNTRFIKSNIIRYINKTPMIIHQDKFMDFIYFEDVYQVINHHLLNTNTLPYDINMSYVKKYKLTDITNIINNLSDYKVDVKIENENLSSSYCGNGERLESLKREQMELSYAREIANTVQEAERYKITIKQEMDLLLDEAKQKAETIKLDATQYVDKKREELARQKLINQKLKEQQVDYDKKLADCFAKEQELQRQIQSLKDAQERLGHETRTARELRDRYETKFRQIQEIIHA